MVRIQIEDYDDGGEEDSSSGTSFQQHGGVSGDQVAMEGQTPSRNGSLLLDTRCRSQQARAGEVGYSRSPPVQQSSLTAMSLYIFQLMRQQAAEQGPMHPTKQDPPRRPPCDGYENVAASPEASSGDRRPRNRNRTKRKKAGAAAAKRAARELHAAELREEEEEAAASNTSGADSTKHAKPTSKKRTGRKAAKDPALSRVEREIDASSSPMSSSTTAEPPSPGKGKCLEEQGAGAQHESGNRPPLLDQMRAWIARMGAGKVPVERGATEGAGEGTSGRGLGQLPSTQGRRLAKDPALPPMEKHFDDTSSASIPCIALENLPSPSSVIRSTVASEPPSPGKDKRLEEQAAGERHETRYWQPLLDQARAWVARMGAGKVPVEGGAGEGAGEGTSGRGLGQLSPVQGKELAESSAMEVKEDPDEPSPAIGGVVELQPPSPGKNERVEGTATPPVCGPRYPPPVTTNQPRACIATMSVGEVVVEGAGGGDGMEGPGRTRAQRTDPQGEGLAESSAVEVTEEVLEAPPAIIEDIPLELPEPTTSKRAEITAAVVESSTGHAGECDVGARAESSEGSTACPSNELELLSPAESSFVEATTTSEVELAQELGFAVNKTSSSTLSTSDVEFPPQPVESIVTCYPLELLGELAAKISGRGEGEVVVEGVGVAVGVGAVEGVAGWVRGPTGWEAEGLVPSMCERRPGDLKALFLRNLAGRSFNGAGKVRVAQMALEDLSELEVVGPLGEGASGTVSAVCHSAVPGNFALKMVREGRGQRAIENAMAEISVLARLIGVPHPNVISALAVDDGQISKPILLPIAECDFGFVLAKGVWSMPGLFRCVQQVGCGAQHMHDHGVVHGDIKPQNILMFRGQGGCLVPQLADFGAARALGDIRPQMTGTVGYMPLECMKGPVAASASQDVFSLAAMTWNFCAASNQTRPNMFGHPDLYKEQERECMVYLEYNTAPSQLADELLRLEWGVTARVLDDGSYIELLKKENLPEDLGPDGREVVSDYLPWLLSKDPAERPSIESLHKVLDMFVEEVAKKDAVKEA